MVRSKYTVLSANAAFISMAVAKVILVLAKAPLIAFAATTTVEGLLTVIFLCIAYRMQRQNMFAWRVSASVLAELLRESWPLVLSGISIMISMRVDQVMIGQYMNDKEVGLYAAAAKFSEIWYFIPVTIASSTYPGLIESKKRDEALYYRRLQQLYDILVTLGSSSPWQRPSSPGRCSICSTVTHTRVPVEFCDPDMGRHSRLLRKRMEQLDAFRKQGKNDVLFPTEWSGRQCTSEDTSHSPLRYHRFCICDLDLLLDFPYYPCRSHTVSTHCPRHAPQVDFLFQELVSACFSENSVAGDRSMIAVEVRTN